jgi:Na+/melibiose symporter-like transporter
MSSACHPGRRRGDGTNHSSVSLAVIRLDGHEYRQPPAARSVHPAADPGRSAAGMTADRFALLVALGVDNFGSGLFGPLILLYAVRVVGLPLPVAGAVVTAGTVGGLLVPALVGRLVDRAGPRAVVITAQVTQATGAFCYLTAHGVATAAIAVLLLAAGQETFFSALFALIADVAPDGPKDRPYAVVGMVRAACFGLGGLAVGGLLTWAGPLGYRVAVAVDGVSFVACAALLAWRVRPRRHGGTASGGGRTTRGVLRDRPYLALVGCAALIALTGDFFLVGTPVYVLERLGGPSWLPGCVLALFTALSSTGATAVLRLTRRMARTTAMAVGAALYGLWGVASLGALALPAPWRPAYLLAATTLAAAANLMFAPRANALAEAAAPPQARGRYLAAFQYAFTTAHVLVPAVSALFAVATWLPWAVVVGTAGLAVPALRRLGHRLPAPAVTPEPWASPAR